MSIKKIAKILESHNIPYYVLCENIFADTMMAGTIVFEQVENLTNYSRKELYDWLGY